MKEVSAPSVKQCINTLKVQALSKLTRYLAVSIVFLFLIFLHRLNDADWQDIYYLHFVGLIFGGLVILFNKKLSYNTVIYSYLVLGIVTALAEFVSFGIAGIGELVSLFCIMLSLFYLGRKTTWIVVLIILMIYGGVLYQYVENGRSLSANDLTYLSWYSSWIGTFIASFAFFIIIGMSIYYLQEEIIRLLVEVEQQKKTIEEQAQYIEHLANHDALTGLPSVRFADDYLKTVVRVAAQKKHQSALLFLDLDGFKTVNDTYGHDAGDEVLKQVAERIVSVIRSDDTACRIGGDEFLVIIERINDISDIEKLCQRLVEIISMPLMYEEKALEVGVSIGAASYPADAKSAKGLRLIADELMYQVKKTGKNNYQLMNNKKLTAQVPTLDAA